MKTNFLDRIHDITNEAIDYIEKLKDEIIFPENNQPRISVMANNTYLLDRDIETETVTVERYDNYIIYTTDGRKIDIAEVDMYGSARLADVISELKEN